MLLAFASFSFSSGGGQIQAMLFLYKQLYIPFRNSFFVFLFALCKPNGFFFDPDSNVY